MESDILQVNLADRADVRAKLPDAQAILDRKLHVLDRAQVEADFWRGHVEYMTRVAGLQPEPEPESDSRAKPEDSEQPEELHEPGEAWLADPGESTGGAVSPVELVVEVVNREDRQIRSRDVGKTLRREGHSTISNTSVSNALYYAASERGGHKIQQVMRGWYAPLTFRASLIPEGAKPAGGVDSAGFGVPAASRDGSSGEPDTGPTENEAGEPLSAATLPQEGNQQ